MYKFVHGDLHGDNIMFTRNNNESNPTWRIIDFENSQLIFSETNIVPSFVEKAPVVGCDLTELTRFLLNDTKQINHSDDITLFITHPSGICNDSNPHTAPSLFLDNFNISEPFVVDNEDCDLIISKQSGGFIKVSNKEELFVRKGQCYGSLTVANIIVIETTDFTYNLKIHSYLQNLGGKTVQKKRIKNHTRKLNRIRDENTFVYTPEYIQNVSIEHIYNSIRFSVFPDKPVSVLKRLFIKMANVTLSHNSIVQNLCIALNSRNFQYLTKLIEMNQILDIYEQFSKQSLKSNSKGNIEKIFDIYFLKTDRKLALDTLRHLLFFVSANKENNDIYLQKLYSFEVTYIPKVVWNSFRI
jgi:hypothetical protein